MKYLQQLASSLGQELIKPRRYNYSEQLLENFLLDNINLNYKFSKVQNKRKQLLETLLVKNNKQKQNHSKACIIYAHGLGSNKLQALPILKYFANVHQPYDICSFDFSGSGKSDGKYTSYGLRQQDDVCSILAWLDKNQNYENYMLWGRSMGSVAIILSQGLILNPKVRGILLDSPFSSFEKISLQIASKRSYIPQFFLQPLLSYLKSYYEQKSQLNPFQMNIISRIRLIHRKILFIYSKNDTIVNHNHSMILKVNCSQQAGEIQIVEDHNMQRSKQTHKKIHQFIQKLLFEHEHEHERSKVNVINNNNGGKCDLDHTNKFQCFSNRRSQSRTRGISLTSKQSHKENLLNNANKIRKSTGGNNGTKINLMVTSSMTLKRAQSFKSNQNPIRLKPVSSVNLGANHKVSEYARKSLCHPQSVPSLNSIDTIESNAEETPRQQTKQTKPKTFIKKDLSFLDITQKFTQFTKIDENKTYNKINFQGKENQRMNSFHLAPFLDEDLNMICSINSICLNKRKIKEKQGTSVLKEKTNIAYIKRPSIQLSRKNRFVV